MTTTDKFVFAAIGIKPISTEPGGSAPRLQPAAR
ncbi:MAG: hypothetical protein RLZZ326_2425 [Planctomycetota bacterium]|jgi:hypothetical protein